MRSTSSELCSNSKHAPPSPEVGTGGEDGSDGDGDGGRVFKESPVAVEVE